MSTDPVTRFMRKFSLVAWAMIIFSIAGYIGGGFMRMPEPAQQPQFVFLDVAATVAMGMAILSLLVTHLSHDGGSTLDKVARWGQMVGWSLIEIRFAWVLMNQGDIPIHPLPMAALLILALSQIGSQAAIWYRRQIDPQWAQTVDPVIESSGTAGIPGSVWRQYFREDERPTKVPPQD